MSIKYVPDRDQRLSYLIQVMKHITTGVPWVDFIQMVGNDWIVCL